MKFRLALAAFFLAAVPAVAGPMCSDGHRDITTSVCGEGQTWDIDAQSCVDTTA